MVRPRTAIREQKYTLVRDEILRAAATLFAARGYRAVTTDDLAEAIGMTKSAMYYYFKNKYEVLSTIFRESFDYYLKHARQIAAEGGRPEEVLRRLIRQHVLNVVELREWTTIYFREESELNDRDRAFVVRCRKEYSEFFIGCYEKGIRAGIFKPMEAMMIVNLIVGACNSIVLWYREDGALTRQELAELIADTIETGYRK